MQLSRCALAAAVFGSLFAVAATPGAVENWPRFRGPTGQGVSAAKDLPLHWSGTENVAWKTEIPGDGWSSPIVFGERIFMTSTTERGKFCHVICVDRKSGQLLWDKQVFEQNPGPRRPDNSFASPTPVTDGSLVYAVFSSGGIAALDYEGNVRWENHEIAFRSQHGLGASPILTDKLLIMPYDGTHPQGGFAMPWDGAVVLAVDKTTGEVRWRGKRGLSRVSHVTPNLLAVDGVTQLISGGGDVIQGHNLENGDLIWTIRSVGQGVVPSIVMGDSLIFSCSGYDAPTIRAVRPGGHGDVTATNIVWEKTEGVPMLASPIFIAPHVYTVTEQGIIHCFDAQTGESVWKHRIGGKHSASPIFADGRIYFLAEADGESTIIVPGAEYKEIARNTLGELCKASMAVAGKNIIIRGEHNLYCIGPAPADAAGE
jgi:outer membrane protein assembly factor BamB